MWTRTFSGGSFSLALVVVFPVVVGCSSNGRDSGGGATMRKAQTIAEDGKIAVPEGDFTAEWDKRRFSHDLWDAVLQEHVDDVGLIDYAAIEQDPRFAEYLYRLGGTDPEGLESDAARLAFWINAYNALTIQGVLATLGVDKAEWPNYRITEVEHQGESFWKALQFNVGGNWHTLDGIEHGLIRQTPALQDSRIHLALVCAAKGCPPLWNRAYTVEGLDGQLHARGEAFVADPERCRFDRAAKTVTTAKIFDWYREDYVSPDFTPHSDSIPAYLAIFVQDTDLANSLRDESWDVAFLDYDWHLNIQSH